MNPALPEEAAQFGAAAEKAFTAAGGVDLARRAEVDPQLRTGPVAQALEGLGVDELDPRTDLDTAAAAAELCRNAGRVVLPYPLVAVLLRDPAGLPFALVPDDHGRANHADLFATWRVAPLKGAAALATPTGARLASKLGPFVTDLVVTDLAVGERRPDRAAGADATWQLVLTGWWILGTTERAVELAVDHVQGRLQFGQPLARFQAVQFQLADAVVAVDGLRELCRFTLWRLFADPAAAPVDALALRLHALEVARTVLRTSQQLHGAAGLCDEYDISVLYRHVQPDLRLPFGATRTATELAGAVPELGFAGLFAHGGTQP